MYSSMYSWSGARRLAGVNIWAPHFLTMHTPDVCACEVNVYVMYVYICPAVMLKCALSHKRHI